MDEERVGTDEYYVNIREMKNPNSCTNPDPHRLIVSVADKAPFCISYRMPIKGSRIDVIV